LLPEQRVTGPRRISHGVSGDRANRFTFRANSAAQLFSDSRNRPTQFADNAADKNLRFDFSRSRSGSSDSQASRAEFPVGLELAVFDPVNLEIELDRVVGPRAGT